MVRVSTVVQRAGFLTAPTADWRKGAALMECVSEVGFAACPIHSTRSLTCLAS